MGKKKSKNQNQTGVSSPNQSGNESQKKKEEKEPITYQVYDCTAVKYQLDAAICKALGDIGFIQDMTYCDIRIVIGILSTIIAVVSHFAPIKFPDIIPLLVICVTVYYFFCGILLILSYGFEKDAIFIGDNRTSNVRVSSKFEPLSSLYTVTVTETTSSGEKEKKDSSSIANFFFADGRFDEPAFTAFVRSLMKIS